MRKMFLLIFTIFTTLAVVYGQTDNVGADKDLSSITYHVYHIFHSVDGISKEASCFAKMDSVTHRIQMIRVFADVITFNSGNSSRDKNAMAAIDAAYYPQVTFQSDTINYFSDSTLGVVGRPTFHGVTHEVSMLVSISYEQGKTICDGGFDANFSDYNVERPSIFFISIGDKFGIKVHMVFERMF